MKYLFSIFYLFLFFTTPALSDQFNIPSNEPARAFDTKFKKLNLKKSCGGHPGNHSVKKKGGVYVFTMHHGDIGKCPTDRGKGNAGSNIPYSERAEIQSQKFKQGSRYIFRADVSMDANYATAPKTTVFQVHQWDSKSCKCGPYVMIFFDKSGKLKARILKSHHNHNIRTLGNFTRKSFEGRWVEIAVDIDTSASTPTTSIYVDGKRVHTEQVLVQDGGTVFFKSGLYRHGRINPKLVSDRVYISNAGYIQAK